MGNNRFGMKQLNVLVDAELWEEVEERANVNNKPKKDIVEEALKKYLGLRYETYTNEDEISGEINQIKERLEEYEKWAVSKGFKRAEKIVITPTIKVKQPISRKLEVTGASGIPAYENTCLYCGKEFVTMKPEQMYCSQLHGEKDAKR